MSAVRAFLAIAAFVYACSSPAARASTFSAVELPTINVGNGVAVHHLPYGRVSPGGAWMLDIGARRGMVVMTDARLPVTTLTQQQVVVLVGRAFDEIGSRHNGEVDVIKIHGAMIGSLSESVVSEMRSSAVSDSLVVENKSKEVTRILSSTLLGSELVANICLEAARVGRKCSMPAVNVNPVAFDARYLGRSWGEVKEMQSAGLKSEALDFFIRLENK